MSTNKELIPEEFLVIINGKYYDKRARNIVKDFYTDEYINIDIDNYYSVAVPKLLEKNNDKYIFATDIKYTKLKPSSLFTVLIQNSFDNPSRWNNFIFKNKKEFEKFCTKYDFVPGKIIKGVYFQKSLLNYDRRKPEPFNMIKYKRDVSSYLLGEIYIDEEKLNTKEYKELRDIVNIKNQKYGIESSTFKAFEGLRFSYGIELETISGCLYDKLKDPSVKDLNFAGVFDGSLRDPDGSGPWGQEYITGVLKGDAGLKQVYNISKLLRENCTVDSRCAFHVHIGSLNWNSEDIVFMYLLGSMIESEIFSMMPHSRRDNQYCKYLPSLSKPKVMKLTNIKSKRLYKKSISSLYDSIFKIVGKSGSPNQFCNKKTTHPKGKHGGYDRERDHRYSWLNFTNIIFNQRGNLENKTIEFRCHSGTLSYTKIFNWIKICMAIVEFVHIGKKDILKAIENNSKITLEQIITKVYPKTASSLMHYIELRKNLFNDLSNEQIDYVNEESNIKNLKELICV